MTRSGSPNHEVADQSPDILQFRFAEPDELERLPRAPKAHHRKSRNGCRTCRSRRVKCDEVRPVCGNCTRRQIACRFDTSDINTKQSPSSSSDGNFAIDRGLSIKTGPSRTGTGTDTGESIRNPESTSETRTRRQLELRLLHTYNTQTCHTLLIDTDDVSSTAWIYEAPSLAVEHDAILFSLFSFTALHLVDTDSSRAEDMRLIHHNYWHMALREHARELQNLSPANFNAACITSIFIRLNALVMLRDRPLDPYTPAIEWFHITRGAMQVFAVAWKWMPTNQESIASRLTGRFPFVFDEEAKFKASNGERFQYLSGRVEDDDLTNTSAADLDAYKKTISYIGGICIAMDAEGCTSEMNRRLIIMPFLVPARFGDLLGAGQPRALVILAHYFALLSRYRKYWYIGNAGEREVHALASFIPQAWQPLMSWPLSIVDHPVDAESIGSPTQLHTYLSISTAD